MDAIFFPVMTSSAILDIKTRFKGYMEDNDHRGLVNAMREGGFLNTDTLKSTQLEDALEESLKKSRRPRVLRGTIPWMEVFTLRRKDYIGVIEDVDMRHLHLFQKAKTDGLDPFAKTFILGNVRDLKCYELNFGKKLGI